MICKCDMESETRGKSYPCLIQDRHFRVDLIANDVESPGGIAYDEATEVLFISEPHQNRLLLICGRKRSFFENFAFLHIPREIASGPETGLSRCMKPRFHRPTDLALSADRILYVSEASNGGRILAFDLKRVGPPLAAVVASASASRDRFFSMLSVNEEGHLLAVRQGGRHEAPKITRFLREAAWQWRADNVDSFEVLPSRPSIASLLGVEATERSPVLDWLYQHPFIDRIYCCRGVPSAYAAIRQAGLIVRITAIQSSSKTVMSSL